MKRKIVWLVVSCLMVAGLLLTSCAPAAAPEAKAPEEPKAPEGEAALDTLKVAVYNHPPLLIADTEVLINDKSILRAKLKSGMWYDFGTHEMAKGPYKVTCKVYTYYHSVWGGRIGTPLEKTVEQSGRQDVGFWLELDTINVESRFQTMRYPPVDQPVSEVSLLVPGPRPEQFIPKSVSGFVYSDMTDCVRPKYSNEEYSSSCSFEPQGTKQPGKVGGLQINIHKFKDETSAEQQRAQFAKGGTKQEEIQIDSTKATRTYDEKTGDTVVVWRDRALILYSKAVQYYIAGAIEKTPPDEQNLKAAAIAGAQAILKSIPQ